MWGWSLGKSSWYGIITLYLYLGMVIMQLKSLHLNVETKYFNDVLLGVKKEEYRLLTKYWKNRLIGKDGKPRQFRDIQYKLGYPSSEDVDRVITFPWNGFEIKENFTHPKFGSDPQTVFAIKLENKKEICYE